MYFGKAKTASEEFKSILNDLIIDAEIKQEVIAHQGGVKQCTVSQWMDPLSERHIPAFQLLLQDEKIVVPICRLILERFNKSIVTNVKALKVNGSIDDNLLQMDILQGELIKIKDKSPKEIIKWCNEIEVELATIKAEALIKLGKNT